MMSSDDEDRYIARKTAENDGWPFGEDADRFDPLTALRIAVTCSHPGWRYLVAFDRQSEERPTDAEAAMLVSFLEEYKQRWYNESYKARLARRLLDVDGGANGVIFHKWGADDWGYRRQSYEYGHLFSVVPPALRETYRDGLSGPLSLVALMDFIHSIGGKPNPKWEAWKAAHPDVFPQAGLDHHLTGHHGGSHDRYRAGPGRAGRHRPGARRRDRH